MEQNTAILIADLSGYTALTEAHGASTAANTIDKFLNSCFPLEVNEYEEGFESAFMKLDEHQKLPLLAFPAMREV